MKKQAIFFILALFATSSAHALAADDSWRGGARDQGPPPEAYAACEGKESGDQAEFASPRGDTVTGTCEQQGDRLVLRPDRSSRKNDRRKGSRSGNGGGGHQGPPPEAYAACEGKESGDQADFTSPHGDTVTGTCEQEGNRLVLRPDHRPERRKGGQHGREEN